MTKAKLAIFFTVILLLTLGYCGHAGQEAKWGGVALVLFLISLVGLLVIGFFALFDLLFTRKQ
jgi:hypothetical protein